MEIEDNGSGKNELNLGDHNSEIYTFELPRVIEGHDMTLCNLVQVHFINIGTTDKSKDVYTIIDMEPAADDADTLVFSWPVSGSATMYSGNLNYRIKFACLDESGNYTYRKWTDIYKGITVGDGFDNGEGLEYTYSDILAQWEARLDALEQNGGGSGSGGGVFYIESTIDDQGVIVTTEWNDIVNAFENSRYLVLKVPTFTSSGAFTGNKAVGLSHVRNEGSNYMFSFLDLTTEMEYWIYDGLCYKHKVTSTDPSLSKEGKAAEAKAVGDALALIKDDMGNISTALDHIIALQEELIGT
jgi:hypothetical protein